MSPSITPVCLVGLHFVTVSCTQDLRALVCSEKCLNSQRDMFTSLPVTNCTVVCFIMNRLHNCNIIMACLNVIV